MRVVAITLLLILFMSTAAQASPAVDPNVRAFVKKKLKGTVFVLTYGRGIKKLMETSVRVLPKLPQYSDEHQVLEQAVSDAKDAFHDLLDFDVFLPSKKSHYFALLSVLQAIADDSGKPFIQVLAYRGLKNSKMGILNGTWGRDLATLGFLPAWRLVNGGRLGGPAQQLSLIVTYLDETISRSNNKALKEEYEVLKKSYLANNSFYGYTLSELRKTTKAILEFFENMPTDELEPNEDQRKSLVFNELHKNAN